MRPREAFKIGFLARCVEVGMSPAQTRDLAKTAADTFTKSAFSSPITLRGIADTIKAVGWPALGIGLAAPPAIGGAAAYLANKATDTDATDIEEIKQKELIETYRRMSGQLNRKKKHRDYKSERKRTGQVFM